MLMDIQQAEQAIKTGDTKTGFEILRGVLAENPDSERAWWVMSGLVQRDQRVSCLEQVLRINPDNQLARETLKNLRAAPHQPETKPPRDLPRPKPAPSPAWKTRSKPARETPVEELQTWLHARGSRIFLTILAQNRLTRAAAEVDQFSSVQAALKKGRVPDQLLSDLQTIPLTAIDAITRLRSGLLVSYQDGIEERSLHLVLADEAMAEKVLGALHDQLGAGFILKTEPVRGGLNLAISLILTILAAGLTAYFYWASLEVVSGRAAEGSIPAQWVINLVQSLGQAGVVLLGGACVLAALGLSAFLLLNPPTRTRLIRR